MMSDPLRGVPSFVRKLLDKIEGTQPEMGEVVEAFRNTVRVKLASKSDASREWIPSSVWWVQEGSKGIVLQLRGGGRFFIPSDPKIDYLAETLNPHHLNWVSAYYTTQSHGLGGGLTVASQPANYFWVFPIWFPDSVLFDAVGVRVTTAAAGGRYRLGLYTRQWKLYADFGEIATDTTGFKVAAGSGVQGYAGLNFVGFNVNAAGASAQIEHLAADARPIVTDLGAVGYRGLGGNVTYGALPATAPAFSNLALNCPNLYVRRSG